MNTDSSRFRPEPPPNDAALDGLATLWLCERVEGFTPERAAAFAAWQMENPRHAAAVARVEKTLALLDEMPAVRAPLEERFGEIPPAPEPPLVSAPTHEATNTPGPARVFAFPRAAWISAAAAVFVLAGALGLARWRTPTPVEHYAAAAQAPRRVTLADGSVLDLNTRSDVRVQLSERERRISLDTGEAHFEVAHDTTRPFVVTAGGISVRAVGTAFTVRLVGDSVDVVVVEGKVAVTRASDAASTPASAPLASPPFLVAGERTRLAVARESQPSASPAAAFAPRIEKTSTEEVRALLAWHDPMTSFTDVPLREVIARFNRRNLTQLRLGDPELGERKIGGMIALDQVEAFVRLLEQEGDISAARPSSGEIVLRRVR